MDSSIVHASFYPCAVDGSCHSPIPWGLGWVTGMFMHGGWDHILGNMLFLAIFGKNVEDAFGHLRYLAFYFAGGFVATMTQTAMTLLAGTAADDRVPTLGASERSPRSSAPTTCSIRNRACSRWCCLPRP